MGNGSDGVVNRSRLIHFVMKHDGSRKTMGLGVSGGQEGFTVVAVLMLVSSLERRSFHPFDLHKHDQELLLS